MKTLAAVLVKTGKPLEFAELEIPKLKPGQVLVKITISGVCHTQILECCGYRGDDKFLPHCLGHEGSGLVQEIGQGVTKVKPGDRVILSWIKGSGADVPGTIYKWNGVDVNAGAITTFSEYSVISENRVTRMLDELTMQEAAMIGCVVPTGVGAVFNTGEAQKGKSIAVFGVGGVGLLSVNAAQIAGCEPIIAVDILDVKLCLAKEIGATYLINSAKSDPIQEIITICPGGVDLAIEASGIPEVMLQSLYSVRNQGGIAVIVGNARHGDHIRLDPRQLNNGKQLRGTWGGDSIPDLDFPKYMEFVITKKLKLNPLMTKLYELLEINTAVEDLEAGKAIRPIIEMAKE